MSLVQIWLESDRARVAVDTDVYRFTSNGVKSKGQGSKLLVIPHANVALAYRGADSAFFQVFAQLYLIEGNDSFDSVIEAMPTRVQHAATHFPAAAPDEAGQCELHVVGYSHDRQQFESVLFIVDLKARRAEAKQLNGPCRIAPGFDSVPALDTDAGMFELARQQVAWMRANEPQQATGGRLLIAEITRDSAAIRDAGQI